MKQSVWMLSTSTHTALLHPSLMQRYRQHGMVVFFALRAPMHRFSRRIITQRNGMYVLKATSNFDSYNSSFSNYGGVSMISEYSHEAALRLLLHTVSTSAARYGRYIEPLVSLSIDFYFRIFVRVHTAPQGVKKAITYAFDQCTSHGSINWAYRKTAAYYVCSSCQAWYEQPLGRLSEHKFEDSAGRTRPMFKTQPGIEHTHRCPECSSKLHVRLHSFICPHTSLNSLAARRANVVRPHPLT